MARICSSWIRCLLTSAARLPAIAALPMRRRSLSPKHHHLVQRRLRDLDLASCTRGRSPLAVPLRLDLDRDSVQVGLDQLALCEIFRQYLGLRDPAVLE